jgi:hypothetical protein
MGGGKLYGIQKIVILNILVTRKAPKPTMNLYSLCGKKIEINTKDAIHLFFVRCLFNS